MPKAYKAVRFSTTASTKDREYIRQVKKNSDYSSARQWLGYSMIDNAVNQMLLDRNADGFVMRDRAGNPIGAVSYYLPGKSVVPGSDMVHVNFLGSDQSQKGIGTALLKRVAKVAVKSNAGMSLSADISAIGFYNKLGFTSTDGGNSFYMTASKTKIFARS